MTEHTGLDVDVVTTATTSQVVCHTCHAPFARYANVDDRTPALLQRDMRDHLLANR